MGQYRKSDGYRKSCSSDGTRYPHISEKTAKKIDVIAKHQGINFTICVEKALEDYANRYIDDLDFIARDELLRMLWSEV